MSNATYEGGAAGNRPVKLTGTGATTIVSGSDSRLVKKLYVTEIAGGTPNVSVEIYNGTTSYFLMCVKPITARQCLEWGDIPLEENQSIRVTSSVANQIDVIAVVVERNPGAGQG